MSVGLQSMSQTRLHNAVAALNLCQQSMYVWHHLVINLTKMLGNNTAKQQTTEPWRMFNRQI